MKDSYTVRRCLLSAIIALLFTAAPAAAQPSVFWQGTFGGDGNWNTSDPSWSIAPAVLPTYTWANTGSEHAVFGDSAGTVTLTTGITASGLTFTTTGYTITGNTLTLSGSGGTIDTGAVNATINSVIAGSVGLTKTGGGTLTLGGINTYTDVTSVIGGVLSLGSNNALGAAGAGNETIVFNGATVRLGAGLTVAEAFTLNGNGLAGVGALDKVGGADSTVSGAITLGSASRIGSSEGTLSVTGGILGVNTNLSFGGGGNVTVGTNGISIGTGSVTKLGAGTLTMNLASTFSGGTQILGGSVVLGNTGALGSGNVAIAPASAEDASLLLNVGGTFSRTISVGVLNDTGTGRVVIGSQTGLTGSSVFSATPLAVRRPFTIQAGASIATTFSFVQFLQEGSTVAHMTISAPTPATETNNRVIFHSPGVASTFGDMTIGDLAGPHAVVQFGSGDNSGNIVPDGSVINFFRAPGGGNGGSVLLLSPGPSPTGETVGALHSLETGAGTITTFNANVGDSVYTLTVGGGDKSGTFSGVIMQGAVAGNADVALAKMGTGTQILSGNNTYTAGTTVNGGTLLAIGQSGSNSGTGTGAVAVNSGGTFGGTGRAAGAVTVNGGGTIRGGDATGVGTLTIGGLLTFTTGTTQGFRITDEGTPADPSTGGSSLGSIPNPTNNNFLNLFGGFNPTGDSSTYQFIIDGTGSTFDPLQTYSYQVALSNGQDVSFIDLSAQSQFTTIGFTDDFNFSLTGNPSGAVFLNFQPVPEPATVLALAAGALGAGRLIRRRLRREVAG